MFGFFLKKMFLELYGTVSLTEVSYLSNGVRSFAV